MLDLLERYGTLLREVDSWFKACLLNHGEQISCGAGCSACCRGLFDITLLDALYLNQGVKQLSPDIQDKLRQLAKERLESIHETWPAFSRPWLLNDLPEEEWDSLMPEEDETPCVLLSDQGTCLAYDYRPMTCRLNGIPLIDVSGEELFDEWCTLNFTTADPVQLPELRHSFNALFAQELLLFREMARLLFGKAMNEIDTFIPAAVVIDTEAIVQKVKMASVDLK
ncbi:YkgJ family cysteine cluster protein [Pelotalea chapellei]|uniref:YkgJ family cysteine cluster protein n=1 Tax=Pelotalea chapellei TaxID=44671 RepID=A0ABS5U7N2_9BACT|nr:YkgJ family cysteine cluster protein [Pelotalea chapellei]MBT1071671.1 YkgJ family cysteine cluster protein [Pelotalea chapellei]